MKYYVIDYMLYLFQYSNKSVLVNNNNILIYKNNILIRFLNILIFEYFVFDNSNIVECILLLLDLVILAVRYSSFPSDFPKTLEKIKICVINVDYECICFMKPEC